MGNMQKKRESFWSRFFKAAYILFFLFGPPETISMVDVVDNHYAI
jgi:hypothetical protein